MLQPAFDVSLPVDHRDNSLVDQRHNPLAQERPVERVELLVRHEVARALVHPYPAERQISARRAGAVLDEDLGRDLHGLQQFVGVAAHVGQDAARAAQRVADDVEGRPVERCIRDREAARHGIGVVLADGRPPLVDLLACLDGDAEAFLHLLAGECAQPHPARPHHASLGGEAGECFQTGERARHPLGQHEVRRVVDELVVLVGRHILALDELVDGIVAQAMPRPLEPLEAQCLHRLGRVGQNRPEVRVGLKIVGELAAGAPGSRVVVHRLLEGDAGVEVREKLVRSKDGHLVRCPQRDDILDALDALGVELLWRFVVVRCHLTCLLSSPEPA